MIIGESEWARYKRRNWRSRRRVGTKTFGYEGRVFEAYYYFNGWWNISLGLHICPSRPNIEIHLPFGFIRIGRSALWVLPDNDPRVEGWGF